MKRETRRKKPSFILGLPAERFLYNVCRISLATGRPLELETVQMLMKWFVANVGPIPLTNIEIARTVDAFASYGLTAKKACESVARLEQLEPDAVTKAHQRHGLKRKQLDVLRKQSLDRAKRRAAELGCPFALAELEKGQNR